MAKKIKKVQVFRHLIQIVLFFLLPGFYLMALNEIKDIYLMIMNGSFNFIHALLSSVELISLTVMTIVMGRFFCGWMCGFGAYNDLIHEIAKNVFKVKYRINRNVDNILKYFKYIVLVSILVWSWKMGSSILTKVSPWDAFAQITDLHQVISNLAPGLTFLVLITIGAFFIERFFCRYLCPLGAFFNIVSRLSIFKISMPKASCGNCRTCTSRCSMGIPLYKKDEVQGGECINCLKCVGVCPRRNAKANILDLKVDSKLTSSAALAACVGVYLVNGLGAGILNESEIATTVIAAADNVPNSNAAKDNSNIQSPVQQPSDTKPGTSGSYAAPGTNNVQSGTGTSNSNSQDNAQTQKQNSANNNTDVQGNRSATNNSNTASNSVKNNNSSTTNNNISSGTGSSNSGSTGAAQKSKYKDGTYTGTGIGFRGGTTVVSVTISNGSITNIVTVSEQDTPRFYQRAVNIIINAIMSKQSTSVDAVSGATYSSRGIMQAVANALSKAN